MVRTHPDPPITFGGCSSIGRAPALQAGGHRFDPVHLHQFVDDPGKNAELSVARLVLVFYQQAVLIFKKMEEVKAFQF